jgi:radical SAM protein with 4Fe4S-binding SPASM domain
MSATHLSVEFPWNPVGGAGVRVALEDPVLAGSDRHFLRFDFYPVLSPSHPDRHLAYFDLPLGRVAGPHLGVSLAVGALIVRDAVGSQAVAPVWRGSLRMAGYCRLTVSLWSTGGEVPRQLEAITSAPMMLPSDTNAPLERIMLAVTQRCNLTCPMCTRQHGADLDQGDIPDDVLAALLDAAPHAVYVGLQGLGEPLLHRGLSRMVRAFRTCLPSFGRIALTTNGTALTRNRSLQLFAEGLNSITVSMDGATKASYEARRTGADFDRVIRNIAAAASCARSSGRNDVWLGANYIMDAGNLAEVPAFVRLAASLGVCAVSFFHGRLYPDMQLAPLDGETLAQSRIAALQIGRETGVTVRFASSRPTMPPRCPFTTSAHVWLTGEVVPCDRMEPPGRPWPTRIFGNVRQQPLLDIWNQPEFQSFRRGKLSGNLPGECSDCTFCDSIVY